MATPYTSLHIKSIKLLYALIFCFIITISLANAQEKAFNMVLPIDCELGSDCWFMNYLDVDSDTGVARDFTCAKRSYEGHKGTDIAIRSMHEFKKGVDVHAVARGKVLRFRDGEEDGFKSKEEMKAIKESKKDCGNGIIIDHGNDWLSQYCHLKQGSIKIKEGDKVRAGQDIAQVGMSGITEHPHIHISVLYKGEYIDPFTGFKKDSGCGLDKGKSLWRSSKVKYHGFGVYDLGFTKDKPDFKSISKGDRGAYPTKNSDYIFFWGVYFGAKEGDVIDMNIIDSSGEIIAKHHQIQKASKARQYYYIGKKRPSTGWGLGTYKAEIKVTRDRLPTQVIEKALDIY